MKYNMNSKLNEHYNVAIDSCIIFYINFEEFNIRLKILSEQFNGFIRKLNKKTNNHKIVRNIKKSDGKI